MDSGDSAQAATSSTYDRNFSLRDYVLASRINGISHNWPFSSKHLQMCMSHGVRNVLPPFEPRRLASYDRCERDLNSIPSLKEEAPASSVENPPVSISGGEPMAEIKTDIHIVEAIANVSNQVCLLSISADRNGDRNDKCSQDVTLKPVIKVGNNLGDTHEQILQHQQPGFSSKISCQNSIPSTTRSSKKLKRHKGKPKKRSLVDIFAEAKPCTLEDLERRDRSHRASDSSLMAYDHLNYKGSKAVTNEANESTVFHQHELQNSVLKRKHIKDDQLMENYFPGETRCMIMKRLKRCKSNLQKRKLSSFSVDGVEVRACAGVGKSSNTRCHAPSKQNS